MDAKNKRVKRKLGASMNEVIIPIDVLVFCNEYINAERSNRYKAAAIKKQCTNACTLCTRQSMQKGVKFKWPCGLKFEWHLKNKRLDPDNIAFAKKFILDGFQKAEFLPNDSLEFITGFQDIYMVEKEKEPHVSIQAFDVTHT